MDCLENIIGLSQTTCECLTDQLPAESELSDYNVSASGIFLDELEGFNINIAGGANNCAKGGIWDRMYSSVNIAKDEFKKHLLSCVAQKYQPRLKNFSWQLGESTFKGTLTNITGTHAGTRISPMQIKGGFIYIKRIGVLINQSAPVTLQIWSDVDGGTLIFENGSTPLDATADTLTWGAITPLELPMWTADGHYIRYYVLMLLNGTFKPKSNKSDCGCGGVKPYAQWIDLLGVHGSDTNNLAGFKTDGKYMNGITVDVDIKCKMSEVICSSEYPLDFENDPGAMNMATCIQLRAGAKLYEEILSSENINRFTMLNREQIAEKINLWNTQYQQAILALCEDINIGANDCYVCKITNTTLQKNLIKS